MGNVNRLLSLQELMLGEYKEPPFIPTNADIRVERARNFASIKLLQGWDAKDVIDALKMYGFREETARKIVVPLYNRLTTPLAELRKGWH